MLSQESRTSAFGPNTTTQKNPERRSISRLRIVSFAHLGNSAPNPFSKRLSSSSDQGRRSTPQRLLRTRIVAIARKQCQICRSTCTQPNARLACLCTSPTTLAPP
ncbi:hypothetical protein L596_011553 [Steinernema carpocapsae]|uniref:Uncharacterized protein n=1 Tax=Steinernema carpocapsae TaxID=34508 RepID=A0A4U5NV22_STECR|nr:hypothetical protein L596_011553 [Steinernema carpocapsae]